MADIAATDDPGTTPTLNVVSINSFEGDLLLAATGIIRVSAAINKPTGNLSLIAGGNLTLNANIDNGTNTLTLIAGMGSTTGDIGNGGTARQIMAGSLRLRTAALLSGYSFHHHFACWRGCGGSLRHGDLANISC